MLKFSKGFHLSQVFKEAFKGSQFRESFRKLTCSPGVDDGCQLGPRPLLHLPHLLQFGALLPRGIRQPLGAEEEQDVLEVLRHALLRLLPRLGVELRT